MSNVSLGTLRGMEAYQQCTPEERTAIDKELQTIAGQDGDAGSISKKDLEILDGLDGTQTPGTITCQHAGTAAIIRLALQQPELKGCAVKTLVQAGSRGNAETANVQAKGVTPAYISANTQHSADRTADGMQVHCESLITGLNLDRPGLLTRSTLFNSIDANADRLLAGFREGDTIQFAQDGPVYTFPADTAQIKEQIVATIKARIDEQILAKVPRPDLSKDDPVLSGPRRDPTTGQTIEGTLGEISFTKVGDGFIMDVASTVPPEVTDPRVSVTPHYLGITISSHLIMSAGLCSAEMSTNPNKGQPDPMAQGNYLGVTSYNDPQTGERLTYYTQGFQPSFSRDPTTGEMSVSLKVMIFEGHTPGKKEIVEISGNQAIDFLIKAGIFKVEDGRITGMGTYANYSVYNPASVGVSGCQVIDSRAVMDPNSFAKGTFETMVLQENGFEELSALLRQAATMGKPPMTDAEVDGILERLAPSWQKAHDKGLSGPALYGTISAAVVGTSDYVSSHAWERFMTRMGHAAEVYAANRTIKP